MDSLEPAHWVGSFGKDVSRTGMYFNYIGIVLVALGALTVFFSAPISKRIGVRRLSKSILMQFPLSEEATEEQRAQYEKTLTLHASIRIKLLGLLILIPAFLLILILYAKS